MLGIAVAALAAVITVRARVPKRIANLAAGSPDVQTRKDEPGRWFGEGDLNGHVVF
jgi:hypothetical protein